MATTQKPHEPKQKHCRRRICFFALSLIAVNRLSSESLLANDNSAVRRRVMLYQRNHGNTSLGFLTLPMRQQLI